MADYISREAALDAISEWLMKALHPENTSSYNEGERAAYRTAISEIAELPAADVRPVERGKWEDVEVTDVAGKTTLPITSIVSMRCPKCNRYHNEVYFYGCATEHIHFCPNCGARMLTEPPEEDEI